MIVGRHRHLTIWRMRTMDKTTLAAIVEKMPQGMDVDDYLLELVNRAVAVEVKPWKERVRTLERENEWLESVHNW
jgi:hypothetical protein